MSRRRIVILTLLLSSCAPELADAKRIVWAVYAAPCAPPEVDWEIPSGGCSRGWERAGRCWSGEQNRDQDEAVRFVANGQPLHQTQFAHEMLHAALACKGGSGDPGHLRKEWRVDLPAANRKLEESGR